MGVQFLCQVKWDAVLIFRDVVTYISAVGTRGALDGEHCPKYNFRAGNHTAVPCTKSSRQATLFSVAVSVCTPRVRAL
jgi:hypothetical protein